MKQFICLILVLTLLLSCLPIVSAAYSGDLGDWKWSLDPSSGVLTISGRSKMTDYAYPEKAPWYSYKDKITQVKLQDGMKSVGSYAFDGYSKITRVSLAETVTSVGEYAFHDCDALTSLSLPNTLESLSSYAFYDCDGITSLMLPAALTSWGRSVFCSCDSLKSVSTYANAKSIGPLAFYQCNNLTSVRLAQSVTTIASHAFYNCKSLASINLPEALVSIGDSAFASCWALTKIHLPKNVQAVDLDAFTSCDALTEITVDEQNPYFESHEGVLYSEDMTTLVAYPSGGPTSYTIPEGVTTIQYNAFRESVNPTELKFPSTLIEIKDRAFEGNKGLQRVNINSPLKRVGASAFYDAKALSNVNITAECIIESKAFYDCNKLQIINLIGCKEIGYEAFYNCRNLFSTRLYEGLTYIGSRAFYYCDTMSSVHLPESLQYVGSQAFFNCLSLRYVYILNPGCYFQNWETQETFGGGIDQQIRFHGEIFSSARAYAQKYNHYTTSHTLDEEGKCSCGGSTYQFDNGYWRYSAADRVAYVYGYEEVPSVKVGLYNDEALWYHYGYCISTLVLGNDTKKIGDSAFCNQTMLTSLNLVNVEEIGRNAFQGCTALERLYIPDSTTKIGSKAFADCTAMVSAVIRPNVEEIGQNAFMGCSTLTRIDVINTDCEIADSIYTLGDPSYTVIAGFRNSTAEAYANKYGYSFLMLESPCDYGLHSYYLYNYTLPDCENAGTEYHQCSCGASYEVEIPALGHNIYSQVIEPTCTENGYTKYACTRCDYDYRTDETEATGHAYEYIEVAPECEKEGYTEITCAMCSYHERTNLVSALGHNYTPQVIFATCESDGYTEYSCSRCPDSYIDDIVAALGHDYTAFTVEPTCQMGGYTEYRCTRCAYCYADSHTEPIPHEYRTEIVAPSCTREGYTQYFCVLCSNEYQDNFTASTGHNYITTVFPTSCRFEGYTEYHCHGCGDHYEADFVPKAPHNFAYGRCMECNAPDPNYQQEPQTTFHDVQSGSWFAQSVNYVVSKGLMNGMSTTKFEPNTAMNRAMLVTVLWRYADSPMQGKNAFTDVKNGQWYTDAVAWAAANGIVGGVGNGKFAPNGSITREQLATILFRYCGSVGIDTSKRADLSSFPDSKKVSAYAKDALAWAVAVGLVTGTQSGSKTYLDPQGNATRAQVATILMRFIENIAK